MYTHTHISISENTHIQNKELQLKKDLTGTSHTKKDINGQ